MEQVSHARGVYPTQGNIDHGYDTSETRGRRWLEWKQRGCMNNDVYIYTKGTKQHYNRTNKVALHDQGNSKPLV